MDAMTALEKFRSGEAGQLIAMVRAIPAEDAARMLAVAEAESIDDLETVNEQLEGEVVGLRALNRQLIQERDHAQACLRDALETRSQQAKIIRDLRARIETQGLVTQ